MTEEAKRRLAEKNARNEAALALREPDRVPIQIFGNIFAVVQAGYTMAEVIYDETLEKKVVPYENRSVSLGFSYNMGRVNTSAIGVLKYSVIEMRYWIGTVLKSLGALFTGRYGMDELSGPVGVVDIVGTTYEETKDEGPLITWMNMLNMIVLLSANLGVMNLLPIPALDGGRLVFLLLEGIMRRPVNKKVEGTLQMITVVLLLFLMVYVMYNDLTRLLTP